MSNSRLNKVQHYNLPCIDGLGNKGQFQKNEKLTLNYNSPAPVNPNKDHIDWKETKGSEQLI